MTDYKKVVQLIKDGGYATSLTYSKLLAQTKKTLCKVIPSYTEKGEQTHYHKNIAKLLKVPKIQQNQAFTEVLDI